LLDEDADLGWLDYGFRSYDPQIGRFPQHDPLAFDYPNYTPYQFAGCEPIANVDLDGLEPANVLKGIAEATKNGWTSITATVRTVGKNIGKWAITGFKDGVAMSRVFKSTGFLTQNVIGAAVHLLNIGSIVADISTRTPKGDLHTNHNIPDSRQMAVNNYSHSVEQLEHAIEHGWHNTQHFNNSTDKILDRPWSRHQTNDITGETRFNTQPTAITPVYPETIFLPLPKFGRAMTWLSKLSISGGAKGGIANSKVIGNAMEEALGMTGTKTAINVGGRTRFPDRLDLLSGVLEESKNVKHLNFTSQLRDYLNYSQSNGLKMILHTRPTTTFSKPLQKLINNGTIIQNKVPGF
jgi:RHS repeat-associated protein